MNRTTCVLAASLLVAACGDDEGPSNNGSTNGATNGSTNGATNGSTNGATNGATNSNNVAAFEGWSVTLEGDEEVFELPDIDGDTLGVQVRGDTVQLTGLDDVGELTAAAMFGEELEATDYGPYLFSVDWADNDYTCVGGQNTVTLTFTALEPAAGTYSGTLTCSTDDAPTDTFEVTLDGQFAENL